MHKLVKLVSMALLLTGAGDSLAQFDAADDVEELKIAALEALMSAPPERALPLVQKVLAGDNSDDLKERALFVLSQIDLPEAQTILLETARQGESEIALEAIRMIGIGGDEPALAGLVDLYNGGGPEVREAVLEAYLIAGDADSVLQIAIGAGNEDDFEAAVETLGSMGAHEQLKELRNARGASESLIDAYAISGDFESLREISLDGSHPEIQAQAIEALGIVGGDDVGRTLVEIYRNSDSPDIRDAALDGLLIAGDDASVIELYRSSQDAAEKRDLLEYLVIMDSDEVWDVIDAALDGQR